MIFTGNVGKELNQLISLMNNEDTENNKAEHNWKELL